MTITQLKDSLAITKDGIMERRFSEWTRGVSLLSTIIGSGSPEGVEDASVAQEYMDTSGVAGAIKYVKRDADIGGDRKLGWVLI